MIYSKPDEKDGNVGLGDGQEVENISRTDNREIKATQNSTATTTTTAPLNQSLPKNQSVSDPNSLSVSAPPVAMTTSHCGTEPGLFET